MGVDMRGDPAAALLEVLDPAQNDTFVDHYIDLPFDLSDVTFIATANYRGNIPDALRDRMEIIEVPGYTRSEKRSIAEQFLVPKQIRDHGITSDQIQFEREGIELIIDSYTREAGRARPRARDRFGLPGCDGQARGGQGLLDDPGQSSPRPRVARPRAQPE